LLNVGTVKLTKTGEQTLSIKPLAKPGKAVMNLDRVRLGRVDELQFLRQHDQGKTAELSLQEVELLVGASFLIS
jgi:hypothetical protein